ncbi:ABC transporter [Dendrothele bispora CBS 962.96]|uniref:ABC transporter n=1 Tax=Dendrothele bispora (strain CBS 962.96) TaxID=1314807 RepID=A0A4S8MJP2_DENBC|nr:ABC transporter [Dendrothele bispora CBS 962.96]
MSPSSLEFDEEKAVTSKSEVDATVDFKKKSRFPKFFRSSKPPPPPKASIDDAELTPEATASLFKIITFEWLTPLLSLGYQRPLEDSDLYKLQDERAAARIGEIILESFERRQKKANEYNERLARGDVSPGLKAVWWTLKGNRQAREKEWREKTGKKRASLVWAMNDSVKWFFWTGGLFKVIGDTAQITSPLLVKALINFATKSYTNHLEGLPAPPVGQGIGMAIGLLALTIIASLCTHHFFYRGAGTGVLLRGGLIAAIYSRSMRLTSRARSKLPNALIMNHISTDVSRIDFCAGFFHMFWAAPIQMAICLVLLLINLGPSALAGFAFFVLATPVQTWVMKKMFSYRQKSMVWTDKRAKLLQELLNGMRIIKFFAWEIPFLNRLADIRRKELRYVRDLLLMRAANNAVAMSLPALASVLSFVTYSLSGHQLNPADIFASLTLFNLLRLPLMMLPMSFSAVADAYNAIQRLRGVFEAETLEETRIIDESLDVAIEVKGATFTWDAPPSDVAEGKKGKKGKKPIVPVVSDDSKPIEPFKMRDISLSIPRGQLVAIVGQVGTGKSSLLQGIIGEMRRTGGTVKFGGSVGYCPQSAWIQNATIRENICFGRPFEEERYWKAVKDSCLEPDLEMLPNGDMTEVGEKGVSLSGGQKQRLNICRAIYCDTEIQIFDDPLSALDAHVGKAVFQNVLRNAMAGKTRVLVTHALHFLPQVDYIYVVSDGRIIERGTYTELMDSGREFSMFVREFGSKDDEGEQSKEEEEEEAPAEEKPEDGKRKKFTTGAGIMQAEERNTGAVDMSVYKEYSKAGRGQYILPFLVFAIVMVQGSSVMSSYWLVYWQEEKWPQPQGFYMGIYAALGVTQAFSMFLMGSTFALMTYFASQSLHKSAIGRVMKAPMLFFETTPLGRIMNRFSKDIDTIDNLLGDSLRMLLATSSNIFGAIILVSIILPWFLIAVVVILSVYFYAAHFYRASARELKRLDAILRSSLYSHFSESLSGLTTIRAYGETHRFKLDNEKRIDIENRAYWLTVTNQRWLGIRLDFLGALLTFVVSLLTVGTRFSISPSQTGVVLSYILSIQQSFGWLVRQSAEVENNMNAVERIVHYGKNIEQEAPHEIPDAKPPAPWPSQGRIQFKDVVLRYRPELPPVVRGISMNIKAGEKIGIVGRTGAGKSSLMTAIYRLVELDSGYIKIDDVDVSKVGLTDLRSGLSIIPQDPLLFSGTLRSNLDPFNLHDDARLWDALKRSYLVENTKRSSVLSTSTDGSGTHTPVNRFTLDSVVEDEGNNLSIGQRSLVSLARALVKDTKILILDEATASVDYETDRKIQDTIAHEFKERTILCIAHRLRTIISYDRICVLDAGQIAEFDTPARLFEQNGIFKGMCDRSSITLDDIRLATKIRMDDETEMTA